MAYGRLAWTANNAVLNSTGRLWSLIAIVLYFTTAVVAASDRILPSAGSASFPECALSCPQINAAADSCTADANTSHSTDVSCFCQSSLIPQLRNSPDGTCDSTCTVQSDRVLLQTWYTNYCDSGGATQTTTSATNQATNTASAGKNAQSNSSAPKSWWDGHYQWVIMVIVLFVGFSVIAAVAIWLKKRHDAKHPNLYHGVAGSGSGSGSGTESGLFVSRPHDQSLSPDQPGQFSTNVGLAPPSRYSTGHSESIASSSRTEVLPSKIRSGMSSTRLQKTPESPNDGEVEIREVPR